MDSFVPALVAALFAGVAERPAWLAARLGDRYRPWILILFAVIATHGVASGIAAALGNLVSPFLNPNARVLMVALALIFAGAGSLLRARRPVEFGERSGGAITGLISLGAVVVVDATAFLTFAFAVRGPSPLLAAIGATVGAAALAIVAATLGERDWRALPLRSLTLTAGAAMVVGGLIIAAGALRLT